MSASSWPDSTTNDHLKYCEVVRSVGGQWAVLGALPWTDKVKRDYAQCPTRGAAEAARRLLSGDAARSLG